MQLSHGFRIILMAAISGISSMALVVLLSTVHIASASAPAYLYVVNALSEDLSIIDAGNDKVVATIPLGASGFRIAFSPQRDKAYVTATQRIKLPGEPGGTKEEQMTQLIVVDLQKRQPIARIPLDLSPMANVHISPDGKNAYVVTAAEQGSRNEKRGRVLFVDLTTGQQVKTVHIGLNPLDSVMSSDGKRLYSADWGSTSISVVDLINGRLEDTFPLGAMPVRTLVLSADGKKLYAMQERPHTVPNQMLVNNANVFAQQNTQTYNIQQTSTPIEEDQLLEINTDTGEIHRTHTQAFKAVYALALSPDGSRLYIYGRTLTATVPPTGEANVAQAQRAPTDGYDLLVMDVKNRREVDHFGNFGYLATVTLNPDGKKLYLVGTPGEPRREAMVQSKHADGLRDIAYFSRNSVMSNGPQIIKDLSDLPKTVTILDAATGKRLGSATVGSLPQGAEILKP